jgi:hypothetical protein
MPKIRFVHEDAEGNEVVDLLPARWKICDRCHGNGTHDPDAFSNGFTTEELYEDPDFAEAYFEGRYDVACEENCNGGKIMVIDEDNCNPELLAAYRRQQEFEYNYKREREHERRMGY